MQKHIALTPKDLIYGIISQANDSTLTLKYHGKTNVLKYADLKTINIASQRNTVQPMIWGMLTGLGFVVSSPFKPSFNSGLKTAGFGVGIIFVSAAIQVALTIKRVDNTVAADKLNFKERLQKYIYPETSK